MTGGPLPCTMLTSDEQMIQSAVSAFAKDIVAPKVLDMDKQSKMDPEITRGLFEQGFMAMETPAEYDGAEASFMSLCLTIEALSKVDPTIGLLVDLQNTVVNNVFRVRTVIGYLNS